MPRPVHGALRLAVLSSCVFHGKFPEQIVFFLCKKNLLFLNNPLNFHALDPCGVFGMFDKSPKNDCEIFFLHYSIGDTPDLESLLMQAMTLEYKVYLE